MALFNFRQLCFTWGGRVVSLEGSPCNCKWRSFLHHRKQAGDFRLAKNRENRRSYKAWWHSSIFANSTLPPRACILQTTWLFSLQQDVAQRHTKPWPLPKQNPSAPVPHSRAISSCSVSRTARLCMCYPAPLRSWWSQDLRTELCSPPCNILGEVVFLFCFLLDCGDGDYVYTHAALLPYTCRLLRFRFLFRRPVVVVCI